MEFIINLSHGNQKSNLLKAVKTLKKEGEELPIKLPNGTKVKYVRGGNFDARSIGNKFSLYKEIIRPDGNKYVTNANVIGDNVYINEIFSINKDGSKSVYSMSPGSSSRAQIGTFNPSRNYPKELKKLLSENPVEANRYSTLADYVAKHSKQTNMHTNKPIQTVTKQPQPKQAKLEYTEEFPAAIEKTMILEDVPNTRIPIKVNNSLDDVVIDDENEYKKLACPFLKPYINKIEKPQFKTPVENLGWQEVID
ncbi:MAG: hypothetical protein ACI4S3_04160 [Candidatus Gastranaerophilaceae bacterium]